MDRDSLYTTILFTCGPAVHYGRESEVGYHDNWFLVKKVAREFGFHMFGDEIYNQNPGLRKAGWLKQDQSLYTDYRNWCKENGYVTKAAS